MVAYIATRPCLISVSRRRWKVSALPAGEEERLMSLIQIKGSIGACHTTELLAISLRPCLCLDKKRCSSGSTFVASTSCATSWAIHHRVAKKSSQVKAVWVPSEPRNGLQGPASLHGASHVSSLCPAWSDTKITSQ